MGSEYCGTELGATRKGLEGRYGQLVEDCLYTYGHGGYTGTFAEKGSVEVVAPPPGQEAWPREQARIHCQDNNGKWDPAFAYWLGADRWYVGGWCAD